MKEKFLVLVALFGVLHAGAQTEINDYKYITVPYFFEFVKGKNTHRLNTTTRFLLKKYGLNAYMDDELNAEDYANDNCLALRADVVKVNALLKTKLKVVLLNCNDEVVYESEIGESKAKSYDEAYKEALIDAAESFENINYKYTPSNEPVNKEAPASEDREESKKEATVNETVAKEKTLKLEETSAKKNEVIESEKLEKVEMAEEVKPRAEKVSPKSPEPKIELRAISISGGYEIVDQSSKVIMTLLETAVPNVYVVKDSNAIAYKENDEWFISRKVDGKTIKEPLKVQF